eukprot:2357045-Amphidinium_carterae.1
MLDYEQPWLVAGGPPCTAFSNLQNLSKHKQNPEQRQREQALADQLLETAVYFYRKQLDAGRLFLHEHPQGCTSWDRDCVKKLQGVDGVFTVTSPMCCWKAKLPNNQEGYVYKPTKWVTNSRCIAEALDRECTNRSWKDRPHRH